MYSYTHARVAHHNVYACVHILPLLHPTPTYPGANQHHATTTPYSPLLVPCPPTPTRAHYLRLPPPHTHTHAHTIRACPPPRPSHARTHARPHAPPPTHL